MKNKQNKKNETDVHSFAVVPKPIKPLIVEKIKATTQFKLYLNSIINKIPDNIHNELWNNLLYVISEMESVKKELEVTDKLLNERQRVLDAIPECQSHGSCVPHALEWIEEMKNKELNENRKELE